MESVLLLQTHRLLLPATESMRWTDVVKKTVALREYLLNIFKNNFSKYSRTDLLKRQLVLYLYCTIAASSVHKTNCHLPIFLIISRATLCLPRSGAFPNLTKKRYLVWRMPSTVTCYCEVACFANNWDKQCRKVMLQPTDDKWWSILETRQILIL